MENDNIKKEDIKEEVEEFTTKEKVDDYLDLTKQIEKKQVEEPKVIKENLIEKPQEELRKEILIEQKPIKKKTKRNGIALTILFILCFSSLSINAYIIYDTHYLKSQLNNPEVIYNGDWDCFTEKCVGYMTMSEWASKNCNTELTECKINYQGQEIDLPFSQINLPPEHELLCREYICSTEIPIRRYSR